MKGRALSIGVTLALAAFFLTGAFPLLAQSSAPLLGIWKLNLAKSKYQSPDPRRNRKHLDGKRCQVA